MSVVVGAVLAANSKTVFQPIVWLPSKLISKEINAPSVALLGAAKTVFSVVKWYAFAIARESQAVTFEDEVSAVCVK